MEEKAKCNKVSKGAKIRNRYNQVPHRTQDTKRKVTHSQLDTTNESQEVSPFPAGDHKAQINRRTQTQSKQKTEKKPIKDPQKKYKLNSCTLLNMLHAVIPYKYQEDVSASAYILTEIC